MFPFLQSQNSDPDLEDLTENVVVNLSQQISGKKSKMSTGRGNKKIRQVHLC